MEWAGFKLREGTPNVPKGSTHGPVPSTALPSLHTTVTADQRGGRQVEGPVVLPAETAAGRLGLWPAWRGVPVSVGSAMRGCPPEDLGVLKAPHFQELHPEVLLAEWRVVEGLAVLRAPPEQVGIEGQSLASPSTCKSKQDGWDLLPPSLWLTKQGHWPSRRGLSGLHASLSFLSYGHGAELGWGFLELPSLLIGMAAWRQSSRRAICRAAAAEVALVAQAELLNCLESWRTRKDPCLPGARLALIPLPRAGREAGAALRAVGISDPGSGGARGFSPVDGSMGRQLKCLLWVAVPSASSG